MHPSPKLFVLLAAAIPGIILAETKPDALFSKHAVLQQGVEVPVWGTAPAGQEVTVEIAGQKVAGKASEKGRWEVRLKSLATGGPHTMTITGDTVSKIEDVLVGEVWVCSGQSNMGRTVVPPEQVQPRFAYWEEAAAKANFPQIREFKVQGGAKDDPQTATAGEWKVCTPETVKGFTAVGYFFARDLTTARGQVPVGLITAAVGATGAASWVSRETLASDPKLKGTLDRQEKSKAEFPEKQKAYAAELAGYEEKKAEAERNGGVPPKKPADLRNPFTDAYRPTGYYNSKIAPLLPYAISGVLWYQGENNRGHAQEYEVMFSSLIRDWRTAWGQGEFPFFFVQLPPHKGTSPEFRETQRKVSLAVPNTAIVVTTDCGDPEDIHPPNKEPIGVRLAAMARGLVYGEKVTTAGPEFSKIEIVDGKAVVTFANSDGLTAKGGDARGFEIAGADRKYFPATAVVEKDRVILSSPEVPQPAQARFAWSNSPDVNVFNGAGFPMIPFQTAR
jgi:sialate O-acetylesterase